MAVPRNTGIVHAGIQKRTVATDAYWVLKVVYRIELETSLAKRSGVSIIQNTCTVSLNSFFWSAALPMVDWVDFFVNGVILTELVKVLTFGIKHVLLCGVLRFWWRVQEVRHLTNQRVQKFSLKRTVDFWFPDIYIMVAKSIIKVQLVTTRPMVQKYALTNRSNIESAMLNGVLISFVVVESLRTCAASFRKFSVAQLRFIDSVRLLLKEVIVYALPLVPSRVEKFWHFVARRYIHCGEIAKGLLQKNIFHERGELCSSGI